MIAGWIFMYRVTDINVKQLCIVFIIVSKVMILAPPTRASHEQA